jgi:hypothetical protein
MIHEKNELDRKKLNRDNLSLYKNYFIHLLGFALESRSLKSSSVNSHFPLRNGRLQIVNTNRNLPHKKIYREGHLVLRWAIWVPANSKSNKSSLST